MNSFRCRRPSRDGFGRCRSCSARKRNTRLFGFVCRQSAVWGENIACFFRQPRATCSLRELEGPGSHRDHQGSICFRASTNVSAPLVRYNANNIVRRRGITTERSPTASPAPLQPPSRALGHDLRVRPQRCAWPRCRALSPRQQTRGHRGSGRASRRYVHCRRPVA